MHARTQAPGQTHTPARTREICACARAFAFGWRVHSLLFNVVRARVFVLPKKKKNTRLACGMIGLPRDFRANNNHNNNSNAHAEIDMTCTHTHSHTTSTQRKRHTQIKKPIKLIMIDEQRVERKRERESPVGVRDRSTAPQTNYYAAVNALYCVCTSGRNFIVCILLYCTVLLLFFKYGFWNTSEHSTCQTEFW